LDVFELLMPWSRAVDKINIDTGLYSDHTDDGICIRTFT
jgi:hypothetical protein